MSYSVRTQAYSGPFALLLQLVSRQKVAIGFHVGIVLGIAVTAAAIALLLRYATPWIDRLGASGVGFYYEFIRNLDRFGE